MKTISAQIVADSVGPYGDRITTYLLTFPRFILAELNTHRMFSRNSASSRAIPFEKMAKMVEEDPFIPIAWQKDHKGMQGTEYFKSDETFTSENPMDRFANGITDKDSPTKIIVDRLKAEWLWGRDMAVQTAKNLHNMGVHYHPDGNISKLTGEGVGLTKQLCNRLLEPFMWHTVLVTATEYENFFELRCPKYQTPVSRTVEPQRSWKDLLAVHGNPINEKLITDNKDNWAFKMQYSLSSAEIHIQALAEAMWDAMNESTPKELQAGEYHIPFGDKINLISLAVNPIEGLKNLTDFEIEGEYPAMVKIATARCARLSYMTFDGEIDYEKDIQLHDRLLADGHMSPFEHCARAMTVEELGEFYKGRLVVKEFTFAKGYKVNYLIGSGNEEYSGWCNNFKGFIPYRYMIEKK